MNNENRILTELPKWNEKAYKGKINWKETIGMELELLYGGEIYKVKVVECKNSRLWVDYDGYIDDKGVDNNHFARGSFGRVLNIWNNNFKYKIGTIFKDDKRDIVITDSKYKVDKSGQKRKWYKYTCNKCGWTEGWIEESPLKRGIGCACCCNPSKILVPEINSIKAKTPWMIDLGVSERDALTHTYGCKDKIEVTCPDCSYKKIIGVNTLLKTKSIGCNCGNGRSYPEKFITNLLIQLGVVFETEYSPNYLKRKRSDFYIPQYKIVIEADGNIGHSGGKVHRYSNKTLEEHIEIDKWKDEQHRLNGIETIRINCFESNLEYIKINILNSELNELFDLSNIDWNKCEEFALKNIVKEVCEYWNNKEEWETTDDLSKKFKLSRQSIIKYLHRGTKLGWCNYNAKNEIGKVGKTCSKSVQIFKDNNLLGCFESASELARQGEELFGVKLSACNISLACNGKLKTHKGFTFRYV